MTKITVDKAMIEQALQQLNLLDGGAGVCESANHVKGHQHTSREPCPIDKLHQDAIAALRAALAEPAVERVATLFGSLPVYDTPPAEVPLLSDEEVGKLTVYGGLHHVEVPLLAEFVRHIEQAVRQRAGLV